MYKSSTTHSDGSVVADGYLGNNSNNNNRTVSNARAKFDAEIQMRTRLGNRNQSDYEKYESQYRRDMQSLSIDRRSMETSMLAYTERMKEITLQRSAEAPQPLKTKPQDGRRWASLSILNGRGQRDLPKRMAPISIPERSMSADETQTSMTTPEKDSLPERPFSDTHNRMFHFMDDQQQKLKQEGQFNDRIRARAFQRREIGFGSLKRNMDKFAELKTHYELQEDAYMPSDEHKNVSIEIFPFPSIEIQAVPAILHRNPKAEKQKKRKKKSEPPKDGEKRSYVFRPVVKTKIRAHSRSKVRDKRRNDSLKKHSMDNTKDKTKKNLDFSYSEAVNTALRNAVEEFEGDLDTVLESNVINVPELKEEIKRLQAEVIAKKKAKANILKAKKQSTEKTSKSVIENNIKIKSKASSSSSQDVAGDNRNIQESPTLKSVLKKEVDEPDVKPKRKSVQFQLPELIRMITKFSEIHRRSPDELESNDEADEEHIESESSDNNSDDMNESVDDLRRTETKYSESDDSEVEA